MYISNSFRISYQNYKVKNIDCHKKITIMIKNIRIVLTNNVKSTFATHRACFGSLKCHMDLDTTEYMFRN